MSGLLLRALAALLGLLPWRALRAIGAAVGWIAGSVLCIRRVHVEDAMRAARIADVPAQSRAMYAALGASAVEFLWLTSRGEEATRCVTIDEASLGAWRSALGRGRGVVIAASHTGNWDLSACALARDLELLVVTKRLRVRSLDRFWQSSRARAGVRLADARGALGRGRDVLRRGGAVAMMIDQAPQSFLRVVPVEFLGRPAFADRAAATLAAAARSPLVVAAGRRDASGAHVLHVLRVLEPPARATGATGAARGTRAWIVEATIAATRALDAFVRTYPDQWLWLHRRWKSVPGPERSTRAAAVKVGVEVGVDLAQGGTTLPPSWRKIRSSSPDAPSRAG